MVRYSHFAIARADHEQSTNRAGADPRRSGSKPQHTSSLRRWRGHRRARRSNRLRRCGISVAALDRRISVCSAASSDPQQSDEPRRRRSALPFRAAAVPFASVAAHWSIIVNLLAGSLFGAWLGAGWATRLASQMVYRVIAGLLLGIAVVLVVGHGAAATGAILTGPAQMVGVIAGFVIGVVAALLGVAGGELLIPTLVPSVKVIM